MYYTVLNTHLQLNKSNFTSIYLYLMLDLNKPILIQSLTINTYNPKELE